MTDARERSAHESAQDTRTERRQTARRARRPVPKARLPRGTLSRAVRAGPRRARGVASTSATTCFPPSISAIFLFADETLRDGSYSDIPRHNRPRRGLVCEQGFLNLRALRFMARIPLYSQTKGAFAGLSSQRSPAGTKTSADYSSDSASSLCVFANRPRMSACRASGLSVRDPHAVDAHRVLGPRAEIVFLALRA